MIVYMEMLFSCLVYLLVERKIDTFLLEVLTAFGLHNGLGLVPSSISICALYSFSLFGLAYFNMTLDITLFEIRQMLILIVVKDLLRMVK